jgi:hypothetical protein
VSDGYYGAVVFASHKRYRIGELCPDLFQFSEGVVVNQPCLIMREATRAEFMASADERKRPLTAALLEAIKGAYFWEVSTD